MMRSSLLALSETEMQLCMRCCDVRCVLQLALCNKRLYKDASHTFAWSIPFQAASETLSKLSKSIVRFAKTDVCLGLNKHPKQDDLDALAQLPNCTALFVASGVRKGQIRQLMHMPALRNLRQLRINLPPKACSMDLFQEIATVWPHIQSLQIFKYWTYVTAGIPLMRSLREFVCSASGGGVAKNIETRIVKTVIDNTLLEYLDLARFDKHQLYDLLVTSRLANLRILALHNVTGHTRTTTVGAQVSSAEDLNWISIWFQLPALTELRLVSCPDIDFILSSIPIASSELLPSLLTISVIVFQRTSCCVPSINILEQVSAGRPALSIRVRSIEHSSSLWSHFSLRCT